MNEASELKFPVLPHRPYIICNMIMSADGKATLNGVAHTLGGESDHRRMQQLRVHADATLAGAGTLIKEDNAPLVDESFQRERQAAGKPAFPRAMTLTDRADLPFNKRFFQPEFRPTVFYTGGNLGELAQHAEVIRLSPTRTLEELALKSKSELGIKLLLLEGGPRLNHQLLAAGLIDELFLTLAPRLVGQRGISIVEGDKLVDAKLELLSVDQRDAQLFLRYRVIK